MINIVSGFDITANVPVDSRIIKTKAEMKATRNYTLPEVYFCICKDDGCLYLYNSNIEPEKENPETGKYVKISGRPTVYHFTPDPGKTEDEIEEEIEEFVKTLNPGDAIIYKEGGESSVKYDAYPNGKWSSTTDEPLFTSGDSNTYRYDIYANSETGENESSKTSVIASGTIKLSPSEADEYFKQNSQLNGYVSAAPNGKGYLITSEKVIYLEAIKSGYSSVDQIITASVPSASTKSGLKEWTLMMNAE